MAVIDYRSVDILRNHSVVLKDVNLKVELGEFVYLIGRVGTGKSTLMKSMYAEVPITTGHADVLGYDLRQIRRRQIPFLRREIGIVFQDFQLLPDRSVAANLDFVLQATGWKVREDRLRRIDEVLSLVGMKAKLSKMPHELSGGEQQRVVIARAMLNKPRLILADEPTGNLDPETGMQIVEQLKSISASGTAVIMATHNLFVVEQYPGRVLSIEGNKLIDS